MTDREAERAVARCDARGVVSVTYPAPRGSRGAGPGAARIGRTLARALAGEAGALRALARVPVSPRAFGSAWTARVLARVRRIPPGATATYGEIARAVGRPGAARAVGAALRANPCPLVIPCHRVVGADGLGGFTARGRQDPDRKRRLLDREAGGEARGSGGFRGAAGSRRRGRRPRGSSSRAGGR